MTAQTALDAEATDRMTFRESIRQALREELERDEDVFLMGEDIGIMGGVFDVTDGLMDEFGSKRVRDTPISEAGITGLASGAAATGTRPVIEIMFAEFFGAGAEPVMNQMSKLRYMSGGSPDFPVTVRMTEGAGMSAAAQHSGTLHTWLAHYPGIKVVAPGSPAAAKGLLKSSIRSNDPVFFCENKIIYANDGEVPVDDDFTLPIGEAAIERPGSDVTVVATQRFVGESLEVAEELDDVDVEVIDLRSLYPLDTDTILSSVEKTGRLVIADESPLSYGTHAEIATRVMEEGFFSLDAPVQRVGVPDVHIPFSPDLEEEVVPDGTDVQAAIDRIV